MKKTFYFLAGFTIVFGVLYLSSCILKLLNINFPPPIPGIIILFILLELKIIKEEFIASFCNFMLKYMILFFIPLFVGVINYSDLISENFWAIALTIVITTVFVLLSVGLYTQFAVKYLQKRKNG